MNNMIHTLTVYRCDFKYLERNNPLKELLSDKIKNKEVPTLTLEKFINEYVSKSKFSFIPNDINRVIRLDKIQSISTTEKFIRYHLVPKAGKQGTSVTLINTRSSDKKDYNFGEDWSATYDHNIFIYQTESNEKNEFTAIFHRYGGSGCKTVFLDTANKILKENGIKLNMELILPTNDKLATKNDVIPTNITLKQEREISSSDIVDHISGKRKVHKMTIKELSLNLNVEEFNPIKKTLQDLRLNNMTKNEALIAIQNETSGEYNNASVTVKMGRRKRRVSWDDFANLIDGFDITDRLNSLIKLNKYSFMEALIMCSDEFYSEMFEAD